MSMSATVKESQKFLDLSYTIQDKFKLESREIEAIIKLTNYSQRFYREFSAGGFVKFNKKIIFCIIGQVATYFIITAQFNGSQFSKNCTPKSQNK